MKIDFLLFKIAIAIILIGCFFDMPAWYFSVVRLTVTGFGGYMAYNIESEKIKFPLWSIVILFNPIFLFRLDKMIWLLIDGTIALIMIVWIVYDLVMINKSKENKI